MYLILVPRTSPKGSTRLQLMFLDREVTTSGWHSLHTWCHAVNHRALSRRVQWEEAFWEAMILLAHMLQSRNAYGFCRGGMRRWLWKRCPDPTGTPASHSGGTAVVRTKEKEYAVDVLLKALTQLPHHQARPRCWRPLGLLKERNTNDIALIDVGFTQKDDFVFGTETCQISDTCAWWLVHHSFHLLAGQLCRTNQPSVQTPQLWLCSTDAAPGGESLSRVLPCRVLFVDFLRPKECGRGQQTQVK
jgi:hypothetical protein